MHLVGALSPLMATATGYQICPASYLMACARVAVTNLDALSSRNHRECHDERRDIWLAAIHESGWVDCTKVHPHFNG
ncbi:uncharacterized protein CcaverHIS019_0511210 [Cutaneotrichosporon cavernicola]|uniref:Uncharacterized protein n=1 Tax=Cutaneotrichosporon cavernicola TaxID=279322 RepID=A0AA48L7V1_9TREE|nr:uncharacterized protein CcaverHIS019_0511210 [Cutaneotrichosporon cavernicola]BEI93493.1 hypothetical protein CcaverHIS019_0511210 [Cutaneotrichosporon cavernicola]BEJ01272.1 hypothetical protein CcaverHIS631_0511290 [Cutaneotrichosporon cavernicola]